MTLNEKTGKHMGDHWAIKWSDVPAMFIREEEDSPNGIKIDPA